MWFKAVVMEIKDNYAIVMKSDSTIVRVKIKENMNVGDMLVFLEEDLFIKEESTNTKPSIKNKAIITILSIAAVLGIFILPMLNKSNDAPYAVVSLDINPSIELELDENKNIVNVNSLNEDGNKLDLDNLKGLSLEKGINELKIILDNNGYKLMNDSIIVGFTFLTDSEDIDYEDYIKNMLSKNLDESKIAYLKGNKQDYEESHKEGISIGRYEAKLDIDEDILEDELENMSVEELLNLLNNKNIYLNEEILDEIKDEVEDKLEETETNDDNEDEDDNDDDENEEEDD